MEGVDENKRSQKSVRAPCMINRNKFVKRLRLHPRFLLTAIDAVRKDASLVLCARICDTNAKAN